MCISFGVVGGARIEWMGLGNDVVGVDGGLECKVKDLWDWGWFGQAGIGELKGKGRGFGETKRYLKGLREVRTNGSGRTETD